MIFNFRLYIAEDSCAMFVLNFQVIFCLAFEINVWGNNVITNSQYNLT